MFLQVAIPVPVHRTFTYSVPPELRNDAAVGKRVLVPFGRKKTTGCIVGITERPDTGETKEILEILDREPLFSPEDLRFYEWAGAYYLHPVGMTLKAVLPAGIHREGETRVRLRPSPGEGAGELSPPEKRVLDVLGKRPEGWKMGALRKAVPRVSLAPVLETLRERGLVEITERIAPPRVRERKETLLVPLDGPPPEKMKKRERDLLERLRREGPAPLSALRGQYRGLAALAASLEEKGLLRREEREVFRTPSGGPRIGGAAPAAELTEEQDRALEAILAGLSENRYIPFLLHGVTGSGKTEIYLRAAREAVRNGGSVLFLVPEIALTPQLSGRIRDHFRGEEIALLHSGISPAERFDAWRKVRRGTVRIVVGARSAVFAPLPGLRLILCDEEHDTSYKQDERFTYSGRDLAIVKARMCGAVVVLGSATPGVQTFFNTGEKGFRYLSLTRRVDDRSLPRVDIVDMKTEKDRDERIPIFSAALRDALGTALSEKKQALLFLNRRGFDTFIFCAGCGHVFRCRNCTVSMTRHAREDIVRCHYCGFSQGMPSACPRCGGTRILSYGVGTEKVEEETGRLFPEARVERMDSDTTQKRGAVEKILHRFDRGDIDILIGTQMIAKGHDFPNVTLVGVISADMSLNLPDFRAAERTFQMLTQVSGRGGRGDFPGKVVIQTVHPDHYAVLHSKNHDFPAFFEEEIEMRRELGYPPFSRMVNLRISGLHQEKVAAAARSLAALARRRIDGMKGASRPSLIGPSESPLGKLKGRYRWQLLLMGTGVKALHALAGELLEGGAKKGVEIRADVDPMNFM